MMREAGKIGPATITLIEAPIMQAKPHPERASAPLSAFCGSRATTVQPALKQTGIFTPIAAQGSICACRNTTERTGQPTFAGAGQADEIFASSARR